MCASFAIADLSLIQNRIDEYLRGLLREYAIDRYTIETKRILDVMNKHMEGKQYFCGDEITIADFMHWKWTSALLDQEYLDGQSYTNLVEWSKRVGERPAVKRGQRVTGFGEGAIRERHSREDFD